MSEEQQLQFPSTRKSHPTVSILQSKRELEEVLAMAEKSRPDQQAKLQCQFVNRQITTGMIADWREFSRGEQRQGELSVRDGEKDERLIFKMMVEEWNEGQPSRVIYKWIRKPRESVNGLVEEEHLYHGSMLNRHKHGPGEYLITRRFTDGKEAIKAIKGTWRCDILANGVIIDENGQERSIVENILVNRAKRQIPPVTANKTIYLEAQRIAQRRPSFVNPRPQTDSKDSVVSILDKIGKGQ